MFESETGIAVGVVSAGVTSVLTALGTAEATGTGEDVGSVIVAGILPPHPAIVKINIKLMIAQL
jgi:hypothetical protein